MRTIERAEPEIVGPNDTSHIVVFVHGLGVDGHGRISASEAVSAIDVVAPNLHELGVPTAHINLGAESSDGKTRYEAGMHRQTEVLGSAVDSIKRRGYERITYIAQSIGAAVATRHLELHTDEQADIHLWAPPTYENNGHSQRLAAQFSGNSDSHINMSGESRIHCRGDVNLVVPASYWRGLDDYSVHAALGGLRDRLGSVHAFFASQDKLYPNGTDYYGDILGDEEMTVLEGDSHTFRYPNMRDVLVRTTMQLVRNTVE